MAWKLVSLSALVIVVVDYFVAGIVSVGDTVDNQKNLPGEDLRS
jgi:hypothetical protein